MTNYNIALYPGDGIGQEVTAATVRVLEALQKRGKQFHLNFTSFPWGVDYYAEHGDVVPDDFLDVLQPFDAIFLGAVGYPTRRPDHITLSPLVKIRQAYDLYACLRPAKLFRGVTSPLRQADAEEHPIDMMVLRENSEGEYLPLGGRYKIGRPEEVAVQTAVHSRRGVERILRFGFDLARTRRKHLTMVTKSNALRYGFVLWDEVLDEMKSDYSDVACDRLHADATAMDFGRRPGDFDVVVGSNLFGDLLTDLSGVICGGLGLAPSANIDPDRNFPSLFEPVHGSAPDIHGQGIANPTAAVLSAAMMLDWLNEGAGAQKLRDAVERCLTDGCHTRDLGGTLSTEEMTDAVIERL